jgi:hypothetical protein
MRNALLLLAMLTIACESGQSVNIDKSAGSISVHQSGIGNSQSASVEGFDGKVTSTQTNATSGSSQTINAENVGKLSASQTNSGTGNAQTMNIRNVDEATGIRQDQSGQYNKQTLNIGNASKAANITVTQSGLLNDQTMTMGGANREMGPVTAKTARDRQPTPFAGSTSISQKESSTEHVLTVTKTAIQKGSRAESGAQEKSTEEKASISQWQSGMFNVQVMSVPLPPSGEIRNITQSQSGLLNKQTIALGTPDNYLKSPWSRKGNIQVPVAAGGSTTYSQQQSGNRNYQSMEVRKGEDGLSVTQQQSGSNRVQSLVIDEKRIDAKAN